jgi:hypothetical protein
MKIYTNYSNKEKSDYNVQLYTIDLCTKLDIVYNDSMLSTVVQVINLIKDNYGSKRLKVKDSIIIICISNILGVDPLRLSNKIGIENKYIYNSRKFFAEIPELRDFIKVRSAFEYIKHVYNSNKILVSHTDPLDETRRLIEYCEKNKILIECNSMTIGVACLYLVLVSNDYNVDIGKFSKMYNVSRATIQKASATVLNIKKLPRI